ncbi:TadE/TadG family type IV pilus assembly protein [Terriglobus roseus]|nr:TadE/TadG family type IV pilus assembly protein [Terriglobus roseus]
MTSNRWERKPGRVIALSLQQCRRDNSGSGLVEFALTIATLMTLVLGIAYCALALYTDHYVADAARAGARYAMVRGATWGVTCASATSYNCTATSSSVQAYLLSLAPLGVKAANTTIVTTWPGTTTAGSTCYLLNGIKGLGCSVKVSVTYAFGLSLPLVPNTAILMTSSSTMPITQ